MLDRGPRDVCIVLMSAIGDVVHGLPVVTALRRRWPGVRVSWVLHPGPAALVRGHPDVADIIVLDRSGGPRGWLGLWRELRRRRFDVVIDLQVALKAGIVTAIARAPVKLGTDRPRSADINWLFTNQRIPPRPRAHMQDLFLEFAEALGADPHPLEWRIGPWESERAWQREFFSARTRPVAPIVVATSSPSKNWPAGQWARVCDALWHDFGLEPCLVGGTSDLELAMAARIRGASSAPVASALGCGLRRLVGILEGSALAIAPDTGPVHMSVAVGTPVIGLYGATNPKWVGPYRFRELVVDAYGDPGEDYPPSRARRAGRMERITVDQVLQRVQRWRESFSGGGGAMPGVPAAGSHAGQVLRSR